MGDPVDLNQQQAAEPTPTECPRPTNQIIPDEDPQRAAEICDEANFDAVGDGLGEDDEYRNDEDEIDDDDESDDDEMEGPPRTASETRKPRRPLPNWLREAFQAKVEECGPQFRDATGMPPLYALHQTFWFPQPSSFFLLKQERRSPQLLFNPRFFLWDPEPLCQFGIPCPNCKTTLQRHQVISRPRRCADFESTFWIIGYRYRCRKCTHPKSGKTTVTFRSWDRRILNVIPPALASEFPAHLSHRSGISLSLFSWMRSCFNYGMGSKQFSDALRTQHVLRYSLLELQYLEYLASLPLDSFMGTKYNSFPRYDDVTMTGPHLYSPTSTLCRDLYDRFIEEHYQEINQYTAMLPGDICAIDQSHKVHFHPNTVFVQNT